MIVINPPTDSVTVGQALISLRLRAKKIKHFTAIVSAVVAMPDV